MQEARRYDRNTLQNIRKMVINQQRQSDLNINTTITLKSLNIYHDTWRVKKRTRYMRYREYRRKKHLCTHLPTIGNANARSIVNKIDELNQFLDDSKLDIMCITETWLNNYNKHDTITKINKKYNAISTERHNKQGGGTLILTKKTYAAETKVLEINKTEQLEAEISLIKLRPYKLPRGYSTCYIACIYIPPKAAIRNNTIKNNEEETTNIAKIISNAIDSDKTTNKQLVIICGDLNGAKTTALSRQLNVKQINRAATRGKNLLDPILTNAPDCYNCKTNQVLGSDHLAVTAYPSATKYKNFQTKQQKITTRTGKIEDTLDCIEEVDWNNIIDLDTTPQIKFNAFYDTINMIQNKCQPMKLTKLKNDQQWMTPHIKSLIQQRQVLYKNNQIDEWLTTAKQVKKLINKRKKAFYSNFKNKDSKTWWKTVQQVSGKTTKPQVTTHTAKELNKGFHAVWNDSKQPDISIFIIPPNNQNEPPNITPEMINEELQRLDTSKAPGPDGISNKILKRAKYALKEIVSHLFNICLAESFVPTQWKEANIIPIPKTNDPKEAGDYRPIALTSSLCKTLERIIVKQILKYTESIWKDNKQYGFLPGRNTMDALIQVIEDWNRATDEGRTTHAVFFDFKKAFDLINHLILLRKLEKLLPKWLTSWIAQYLTGRKQRVKSNNQYSDWLDVEAGVIQGSVLGPILFIIFISDINSYIPPVIQLIKYADDLGTYNDFKDTKDDHTQLAIDGIEKWAKENGMQINTNKTKHMIINQQKNQTNIQPTLNNQTLEQVKNYKYLGAIINEELNSDEQWNATSKKTNCHIYLIKTLKSMGFKEEILVNVYQSITLSQYLYAAPLLISASKTAKEEMMKQQSRFFNIIGITAARALGHYNIPTIESYIDQQCLAITERILGDQHHPITAAQESKKSQYNTRGSQYVTRRTNTSKYQNSCLQTALRMKRDGYKNKYTNPRRAEVTTNEYLVEIQTIKKTREKKNPKRLQETKSIQDQKKAANSETVECKQCGLTFKAKGIKRHTTVTHNKAPTKKH